MLLRLGPRQGCLKTRNVERYQLFSFQVVRVGMPGDGRRVDFVVRYVHMVSDLFFAGKRRGQKAGDEEGPGREVLPYVSFAEGRSRSDHEALRYE